MATSGTRVAKRSAGREDGEVTEPPRGVGPEAGDNARAQRGGTAGRRGRCGARSSASHGGTVFVVVTFVAVLYNAVLRSPLIFLRLAESSVGEMDMLVTPYVPHFDPLLDLDAQEQV